MIALAPNTPVVIGVGFYQEKLDDPLASLEPYQLMLKAIRDAARDATVGGGEAESLLKQLDSISICQGMWEYKNPASLLADNLGCVGAKSVLTDLGVLQLGPLFDLCQAIEAGEQDIGVVTGGEAKYRELRSKITQQPIANTVQAEDTPAPDVFQGTPDPFASELESQAGIFLPVQLFAIIESALRHYEGLGIEEHRDKLAELYSSFSAIAADNPHAWNREVVAAQDIRDPVGKNAMLAFPYTKKHNTQWNVNQSVAIVVCSAAKAEALGLSRDRWIYPLSQVQSRHVVCLSQQQKLYSHPGTIMAGERALSLAGASVKDLTAADLYSCFPAAVRSFALDLGLEGVCPYTVTGSMAFAGGPYNHGGLDGVARMIEVLREGAKDKQLGLVSCLSGIFGKQAIALFSNEPNEQGYGFEDVTEAVAAVDTPLPLDGDYIGPATVVGYTVAFNKDDPGQAFAYCDTPAGARTVVTTVDQQLLRMMMQEEFVGRTIQVLEGRVLSL